MLLVSILSGIIPSGPESSSRVHNRLFLPKMGNDDDGLQFCKTEFHCNTAIGVRRAEMIGSSAWSSWTGHKKFYLGQCKQWKMVRSSNPFGRLGNSESFHF